MDRSLARFLIMTGALLVAAGIVLLLGPRIPWLGRLPGDLRFERGGISVFIPIATCLLISVLITLAMNLLSRR